MRKYFHIPGATRNVTATSQTLEKANQAGTRVRKAKEIAMASSRRNEKVAEELVDYAVRHDVKAMFEYYLQRYWFELFSALLKCLMCLCAARIIVEKPENPIEFLIDTIQQHPFVSKQTNVSVQQPSSR